MHRTLFTPYMVEAFRSCKRAYEVAYSQYASPNGSGKLSGICKRFLLKAIAEINRGRITSVHQVQRFMGQHWPLERFEGESKDKDLCTRAFLFAYKSLIRYSIHPYRSRDSEVAAVALRVRARVAHVRVYVEDTIDMVLWNPTEKRLELVNFQTQPSKAFNPAWPTASVLFKHYLAERLKIGWPYEKLVITNVRITIQDFQATSVSLDESIFRVHWDELVRTLEEMKQPERKAATCSASSGEPCKFCVALKIDSVHENPSGFALSA